MKTPRGVVKDPENELPIPVEWRATLARMVEALKAGDFGLCTGVSGVRNVSPDTAQISKQQVRQYGGRLASLPEETWESSVYLWMDGYWQVLVDLYMEESGRSDLVLDVRVYESQVGYEFEFHLVYVP